MQTIKHALLLTLWWLPRTLCILYALFLGVSSFMVFGQGSGIWKTTSLFISQNIPTIIVVIMLSLSWKRSWLGGICFFLLGFIFFLFQPSKELLLFSILPPVGIGLLFYLNWILREEIKTARKE